MTYSAAVEGSRRGAVPNLDFRQFENIGAVLKLHTYIASRAVFYMSESRQIPLSIPAELVALVDGLGSGTLNETQRETGRHGEKGRGRTTARFCLIQISCISRRINRFY